MYRETITDRSAWTGSDLEADRSWCHELDDEDRAQLDRALTEVNRRGLTLADIERGAFPLGPLEAKLAAIGAEIETGRGFALLRGLDVDHYPLDDLEKVYWGLCSHLGTGVTQNSDASLIHYVTDGALRPNQGTRGVGNPARASLHVDLADCVSLLCVRQAPDNPPSWVASSTTVHNRFVAEHPACLPALYEGFEWDRLEEQGPAEAPTTGYRVPVFSERDGRVSCRYNRYWMTKAIQRTRDRLPDETWALFNLFDELAHEVRLEVDVGPGDIQFVNNYTVLHGRDAHDVVDDEDRKRLLMRIWLDFDRPRPLADPAVVRYGIIRHGSLGWTAAQYRAGLHQGVHPRDAEGRPLVDAGAG
jgi:hypothetical protein